MSAAKPIYSATVMGFALLNPSYVTIRDGSAADVPGGFPAHPRLRHRAASHYAKVLSTRQRAGKPTKILDAQIAGIALAAGANVATRNVADFEGCGVAIINPWETAS